MVVHARSALPQASRPPLRILRTETVLSRFPIHTLTTQGRVTIHLQRSNAQGDLDYLWEVSTSTRYGPPGPLAYKLDTLVINRLLDALPRPVPSVLLVGSLRQVAPQLALNTSGRQQEHLKHAFHQNASAYIVTKLRYRDRAGHQRRLEAGFTRYSVVFQGERLPDGTPADALYLVLSAPYREVLDHAPVRPLDYGYLQALTPMTQRLYEILSYPMFAALTHGLPHATLRYSEYCLLSTQQRYRDAIPVQKQMYKIHRPHLVSGYIGPVRYAATTDAEGQPDWLLHYPPGPKARAEYAAFRRQPSAESALPRPEDAEQADLLALVTPEVTEGAPSPQRVSRASRSTRLTLVTSSTGSGATAPAPHPQAEALVQRFYQRFHGLTGVTPSAKEVEQAGEILATHGEATADFFLTYAHTAARETQYQPQVFGGILHYLPRALAAYNARTAQAAQVMIRQQEAAERAQHERYVQWRHEALARQRAALPAAELAALEAAQQARLVAEGTAPVAVRLAVRLAVDAGLEAQAGLPDFDTWRQQQADRPLDEGGRRRTPVPRGA